MKELLVDNTFLKYGLEEAAIILYYPLVIHVTKKNKNKKQNKTEQNKTNPQNWEGIYLTKIRLIKTKCDVQQIIN